MGLDKDDIKALIAILQKGLQDDDQPVTDAAQAKKSKKKTKDQPPEKPIRQNKFLSMSERNMHKDDIEIDRKLRVAPLTERARHFDPVLVKCRVCGKEEKINPSLLESRERYKCNKCSTSAG